MSDVIKENLLTPAERVKFFELKGAHTDPSAAKRPSLLVSAGIALAVVLLGQAAAAGVLLYLFGGPCLTK